MVPAGDRGAVGAEGQLGQRRHGHDGERRHHQQAMRPAGQWIALGADHKDHQHLRAQRLDEPPGLKQRFLCVQPTQQHPEGDEVEHRADRPDDEHEPADVVQVERVRLLQVFEIGRAHV